MANSKSRRSNRTSTGNGKSPTSSTADSTHGTSTGTSKNSGRRQDSSSSSMVTATQYLHQKVTRPIPPSFQHLLSPSIVSYVDTIPPPDTNDSNNNSHHHPISILVADGVVSEYHPTQPSTRTPDLWTITYAPLHNYNHTDTNTNAENNTSTHSPPAILYSEQITLSELQIAIQTYQQKSTSTSPSTTNYTNILPPTIISQERNKVTHYSAIFKDRSDMGMQISIEHDILWKCVLVAAFELEWVARAKALLDEHNNITNHHSNINVTTNVKNHSLSSSTNDHNHNFSSNTAAPKYYSQHPTSYLGGQYRPPPNTTNNNTSSTIGSTTVSSSDNNPLQIPTELTTLQPSQLGQRVKSGIQKAYDYYLSQYQTQYNSFPSTATHINTTTKSTTNDYDLLITRRSTRLEKIQEEQNNAKLLLANSNNSALLNKKQPKLLEPGGCVAYFLLYTLGFLKTTDNNDNNGGGGGEDGPTTTTTEGNHGDALSLEIQELEATTDYKIYGNSILGYKHFKTKLGSAGEVLQRHLTNSTTKSCDDDDDNDENSESKIVQNTSDTEQDEEEEADDDDEINPFFKPNPHDILLSLAKQSKFTQAADIQTAICYAMEDSINLFMPLLDPLQLVDYCVQDDSTHTNDANNKRSLPKLFADPKKSHLRATLKCTSGDKLSDLPRFEPSSFSRCRFELDIFQQTIDDEEEESEELKIQKELEEKRLLELQALEQQRALEQYRKEEKSWRTRKQFEAWRFSSITSGYTKWPNWNDYVTNALKKKRTDTGEKSNDSGAAAMQVDDAFPPVVDKVTHHTTVPALSSDQSLTTHNGEITDNNTTVTYKESLEASDAALAQSLAAESASGLDLLNNNNTRRSRRSTRNESSTNDTSNNTTSNLVFYGSTQSLTGQQLIEAIYRLVLQSEYRGMTLLGLVRLVIDDGASTSANISTSDLRKVRNALGKLLYRYGKLERFFVNASSDCICWKLLNGNHDSAVGGNGVIVTLSLNSFITTIEPKRLEEEKSSANVEILPDNDVDNKESISQEKDRTDSTPDEVISSSEANKSLMDEQNRELLMLQSYIRSLHMVELSLRALLLNQRGQGLQQISSSLLAISADESENDIDAMDGKYFMQNEDETKNEVDSNIDWITSPSHQLLNQIIYRPSATKSEITNRDPPLPCTWFQIIAYTPSVPISPRDDENEDNMITVVGKDAKDVLKDNKFVERRIRFRAKPVPSPLSDSYQDNYDASIDNYITLTEGQVYAGIHAASLEKLAIQNVSGTHPNNDHPFRDMIGMRVLLYSVVNDEVLSDQCLRGLIVGHDSVLSRDSKAIEFRVLILEEHDDDQCPSAFWCVASLDDGMRITSVEDSEKVYQVEPQEYHPDSAAYKSCETVLELLKKHVKIMPFMNPVDPVALGIPDYFDVVKNPMDISTIEKKLISGKYRRISPSSEYMSPISKMLYGPFHHDVMLVFDNAMLYNPRGDWIHEDAAQLKRMISKKIETLVSKAERDAYNEQQITESGASRSRKPAVKKSIYVDEDSDVDMYEYESDYDYEESGNEYSKPSKKKRRSAAITTNKLEDCSTRTIENPVRVPSFMESSIFSGLPLRTDARRFGLPFEWSCRTSTKLDDEEEDNAASEVDEKRNDEQLSKILLLQLQLEESTTSGSTIMRRSTRSHINDDNAIKHARGDDTSNDPHEEYYLLSAVDSTIGSKNENNQLLWSVGKNRFEVEVIREKLHEEYYAKLYNKYFPNSNASSVQASRVYDGDNDDSSIPEDLGRYAGNSFPPYLGRIVPENVNLLDLSEEGVINTSNISWEIRSQYIIPALRWVLRGLCHSYHLGEWETLQTTTSSDGTRDMMFVMNHIYYPNQSTKPFDVLDVKELLRRKRSENAITKEEVREEEVELSAYERMRAERVARNKEKLKALGLV